MVHADIEELGLVERYVAGTLPAGELEEFEAHLIDCKACLDQVDQAERLRAAFLADEPAASKAQPLSRRAPWRTWFALPPTALAAGLAVGVAVLVSQRDQAREELRVLRVAADLDRQSAAAGPGRRAPRPSPAEVYSLPQMRGGASDEPDAILRLPREPTLVVLSFEATGFEEYRATLADARGRALVEGARLLPDAGGGLALALDSPLLPPGDYVLDLAGVAEGRRSPVARYHFRTQVR